VKLCNNFNLVILNENNYLIVVHCRFVDGLGCLGLHAEMKANSKPLRYLFLAKVDPLTAKDLIDLFSPHCAEEGSNRRHN